MLSKLLADSSGRSRNDSEMSYLTALSHANALYIHFTSLRCHIAFTVLRGALKSRSDKALALG